MNLRSLVALAVSSAALLTTRAAEIPDRADAVKGLGVGDRVPSVTLQASNGDSVALQEIVRTQPTVLIFYRGGWCPYCTKHLAALADIHDELRAMEYELVAISPDRPEKAAETLATADLGYRLLSDASAEAARAFGLAFRVDDATIETYKGYGIDLAAASGHDHHQLPVPAVFVVGTDEQIRFAHINPDYKQRLDPQAVVAAAREALQPTADPAATPR